MQQVHSTPIVEHTANLDAPLKNTLQGWAQNGILRLGPKNRIPQHAKIVLCSLTQNDPIFISYILAKWNEVTH